SLIPWTRLPCCWLNSLMKCAVNSGKSSRRSRNGGSLTVTTLSRKNRSWRNLPAATAASRSWFVADSKRTFTLIDSLLPMRRTSLFSKTRSSLAWSVTGMSPTSSRKSVPALQLAVGAREAEARAGLIDNGPQLPHVHRLGEVVGRALLDRFDRGLDVPVARDQDHFGFGQILLGLPQQGQAVQVFHAQVG